MLILQTFQMKARQCRVWGLGTYQIRRLPGVQGHAPPAQLASAQLFAAKLGTGPQRVVLLKGMTRAITLFNQKDQDEVQPSNLHLLPMYTRIRKL